MMACAAIPRSQCGITKPNVDYSTPLDPATRCGRGPSALRRSFQLSPAKNFPQTVGDVRRPDTNSALRFSGHARKRRPRYRRHAPTRRFEEKYKELNPERYVETVES